MLLFVFCILALTSSSVPPFFVDCTAQLCERVCPFKWSPFNMIGLLFFVLAFMMFVLLLLTLSPRCVDTVDVESKMC